MGDLPADSVADPQGAHGSEWWPNGRYLEGSRSCCQLGTEQEILRTVGRQLPTTH